MYPPAFIIGTPLRGTGVGSFLYTRGNFSEKKTERNPDHDKAKMEK